MNIEVEHLTFQLDEVTIHAAAAGPQEGPVVILLHGFPEFWYGWRGQIAPLASAGVDVAIAPNGDAIQANAARRLKLLIFDPNL